MCQVDTSEEMTSLGIPVYRVQITRDGRYYPLFDRNYDGSFTDGPSSDLPWPIQQAIHAKNYREGLGFMSFREVVDAARYIMALVKSPAYREGVTIVHATLPIDAKYFRGYIGDHYIGAGIDTIRSDKIILR